MFVGNNKNMEKSLSYSDVYLKPRYSELLSRADADISVNFLGRKFKAPWMPANMASVINEDIAKWLSENDYFYIMHRFGNLQGFLDRANSEKWKTISISIGVKEEDHKTIDELVEFQKGCAEFDEELRVDFVTIDIAHGHSILMRDMIWHIKKVLPTVKLIAGNVCTPEAVRDLTEWGADCVKVGIAGGGACSTKNMTGFHIPMFSCIRNCCCSALYSPTGSAPSGYYYNSSIPIIADGGIKDNGDIAKALVAGGSMVMAGSMFAACIDAPGETVEKWICTGEYIGVNDIVSYPKLKKKMFKCYYGSASARQKGTKKHVEGFEVELPCNGLTYAEKYAELIESLQSAVSYGGGKDLSCFKDVEWVTIK